MPYMSRGSVLCCHHRRIYNGLTVIVKLSQAWPVIYSFQERVTFSDESLLSYTAW